MSARMNDTMSNDTKSTVQSTSLCKCHCEFLNVGVDYGTQ